MNKIAVIGNACSGKTALSLRLAEKYSLPLTHVDSIQFLEGMKLRNPKETCEILSEIAAQERWIVDGLGPLRIVERRFEQADKIIFIRIPLWKTYLWCFKRQIKGLFVRRAELPAGCYESTFSQTYKLITTIWNVHHGLWPQLDRIFSRPIYVGKVIYVRTSKDLKRLDWL